MPHPSARRFTSSERVFLRRQLGFPFAGLVLLAALAGAQEEPLQPAQLARQTEILAKRVELASQDDFYLVLDPGASKMQLLLKGAVLRDYPIIGLEVGVPRAVFRPRHLLAESWQGRIWAQGNLNPSRDRERFELDAPPPVAGEADSTAPAMPIPPTPEEAYPVPNRYHIRYAGGLSVEVRPREADESTGFWTRLTSSLRVWWPDFRAALHKSPEDAVRLRLVLRPEDAASLYRALPPDTRLLVIPRS